MKPLMITLTLLLFKISIINGHAIPKLEITKGTDIYEVRDSNGTSVRIVNPKAEKPTLREIVYYHVIERAYGSDEENPSQTATEAGPDFDETRRPFTNGHGYQFLDENEITVVPKDTGESDLNVDESVSVDEEVDTVNDGEVEELKDTSEEVANESVGADDLTDDEPYFIYEESTEDINFKRKPTTTISPEIIDEVADYTSTTTEDDVIVEKKNARNQLFNKVKERYHINRTIPVKSTSMNRRRRETRQDSLEFEESLPFDGYGSHGDTREENMGQDAKNGSLKKQKRDAAFEDIPEAPTLPEINFDSLPAYIRTLISTEKPQTTTSTPLVPNSNINKFKHEDESQEDHKYSEHDVTVKGTKERVGKENEMKDKFKEILATLAPYVEHKKAKKAKSFKTYGMNLINGRGYVWNDLDKQPGIYYNVGSLETVDIDSNKEQITTEPSPDSNEQESNLTLEENKEPEANIDEEKDEQTTKSPVDWHQEIEDIFININRDRTTTLAPDEPKTDNDISAEGNMTEDLEQNKEESHLEEIVDKEPENGKKVNENKNKVNSKESKDDASIETKPNEGDNKPDDIEKNKVVIKDLSEESQYDNGRKVLNPNQNENNLDENKDETNGNENYPDVNSNGNGNTKKNDQNSDKEEETNRSEVPKTLDDLINNEQFWKWMTDLTEAYTELLMKYITDVAREEVTKQMKAFTDIQKSLDTKDKDKKETLDQSEKDKDPLIKDNKIIFDGKEIPITKNSNLDIEKEIDEIDDVSEFLKRQKNKKDKTPSTPFPNHPDIKGNLSLTSNDSKSNDKDSSIKVDSQTIYGNSVGSNKVTNIFIFNLNKDKEIIGEIIKNVTHGERPEELKDNIKIDGDKDIASNEDVEDNKAITTESTIVDSTPTNENKEPEANKSETNNVDEVTTKSPDKDEKKLSSTERNNTDSDNESTTKTPQVLDKGKNEETKTGDTNKNEDKEVADKSNTKVEEAMNDEKKTGNNEEPTKEVIETELTENPDSHIEKDADNDTKKIIGLSGQNKEKEKAETKEFNKNPDKQPDENLDKKETDEKAPNDDNIDTLNFKETATTTPEFADKDKPETTNINEEKSTTEDKKELADKDTKVEEIPKEGDTERNTTESQENSNKLPEDKPVQENKAPVEDKLLEKDKDTKAEVIPKEGGTETSNKESQENFNQLLEDKPVQENKAPVEDKLLEKDKDTKAEVIPKEGGTETNNKESQENSNKLPEDKSVQENKAPVDDKLQEKDEKLLEKDEKKEEITTEKSDSKLE